LFTEIRRAHSTVLGYNATLSAAEKENTLNCQMYCSSSSMMFIETFLALRARAAKVGGGEKEWKIAADPVLESK
jgi:hypothetical protein